jgi:hypothetical protein
MSSKICLTSDFAKNGQVYIAVGIGARESFIALTALHNVIAFFRFYGYPSTQAQILFLR